MVFRHYRELVTEKGAKAWFDITPAGAKAVREQAGQERQAKIVAHLQDLQDFSTEKALTVGSAPHSVQL
jgi:hypothetical protein